MLQEIGNRWGAFPRRRRALYSSVAITFISNSELGLGPFRNVPWEYLDTNEASSDVSRPQILARRLARGSIAIRHVVDHRRLRCST